MSKHSVISLVVASFMSILVGCTTDSASSVSVTTAGADVQLQSIAPGVSVGEHANQHVVVVSDKAGADWLASSTQQEYNTVHDQYARSGDASLLPRLSYLRGTLQATAQAAAASAGNPFLITSTAGSDLVVGPSCSGGDGSECKCANGCFCTSADSGCGCSCGGQ